MPRQPIALRMLFLLCAVATGACSDEGSGSNPSEPSFTDTGDNSDAAMDQDAALTQDAAVEPDTAGLNMLYIGHSFGRPFANQLPEFTAGAGIENHMQQIVFSGGASGAPQALWDDTQDREAAQAILDGGDVDVLVMICCSESFLVDFSDPGIELWMDYALSNNPDTRFVLAMPWVDFPEDYADAAEVGALWHPGHDAWHGLIDDLRGSYPGVSVTCLPHGHAAVELRERLEAGTLTDIDQLRGPADEALHTDAKGHAGQMLRDVGSLTWLSAIYDVSIVNHPIAQQYEDDVVGIAEGIVAADDHIR